MADRYFSSCAKDLYPDISLVFLDDDPETDESELFFLSCENCNRLYQSHKVHSESEDSRYLNGSVLTGMRSVVHRNTDLVFIDVFYNPRDRKSVV